MDRIGKVLVGALALLLPVVWLLLPESPKSVGLRTYGEPADAPEAAQGPRANPITLAMQTLVQAARKRDFWLLFFSFFICGASTNGYIGTHFIAFCFDGGIPEVRAAGILAMMGIFNMVGTTFSGWLTDRYDPRWLLFWYYGLRGVSLLFLPLAFGSPHVGLILFCVVFGLDWVATVPPTVGLTFPCAPGGLYASTNGRNRRCIHKVRR